ncbi:uncharacterized protein Dwil_GK10655 [Drosophila willistoni]|uniref:Cilia- and flagella-associated protein 161 n=1 Tax=Drosophila willistoni TaxID=7260 RepID=B4MIU1_DROWI|nr:cilia- and flagella-associated protein 161 [Drosophila willistoni]EDW72030.1 uncharacterized protein Dwil_GK10655 [Drosophila willistoni]
MPCKISVLHSGSRRFRPVVRIGNWFEDHCLEQEKIKHFKKMRDKGELLVEKARTLFDNFHKEIVLAAPKETVIFGAVVQLMPIHLDIENMDTSDLKPALSVLINERVVRSSQSINDDCELSVAPSGRPCVRNSFRIISGDDTDRTGEHIKFGQRFRLECLETENDPIWLYSAPKQCNLFQSISTTFNSHKHGELNLPLGLVHRSKCGCPGDVPKAYTNWFCINRDPLKRFETDGMPLPSNAPLVIVHAATNKNLAAENVAIQTLFGPEFLVSVQNYRNVFKREIWKNVWMISNGHPTNANSKS